MDVTFDLNTGTYKPYCKPNDKPLYINKQSNHPPSVLNNIAEGVNRRLTDISSNEELFEKAAPIYQKALNEAGYTYKLKLDKKQKEKNKENGQNKRKRMRNIIWFNPPYSMNVSTNIASKVLTFIKDCFPEGHPLHKIFNKNTVKVSYKTTPNVKQLISSHNSTILKQNMRNLTHYQKQR